MSLEVKTTPNPEAKGAGEGMLIYKIINCHNLIRRLYCSFICYLCIFTTKIANKTCIFRFLFVHLHRFINYN